MTTRTLFLVGYGLVGLALLALVVLSRRTPSRVATAAELADVVTRRRVGRLLVLVVWWWVGFHALARSA